MVVCIVASLLLAGCSRGMLELLVLMPLCGSRLLEDGGLSSPVSPGGTTAREKSPVCSSIRCGG
jgi:hypothetical protein